MKKGTKAPGSYRNIRRPSIQEALVLEGGTFEEALNSLEKKGYFDPPPKPWSLGVSEQRGHGRQDFAVLDCFGDPVVENVSKDVANLIVNAVNEYKG